MILLLLLVRQNYYKELIFSVLCQFFSYSFFYIERHIFGFIKRLFVERNFVRVLTELECQKTRVFLVFLNFLKNL